MIHLRSIAVFAVDLAASIALVALERLAKDTDPSDLSDDELVPFVPADLDLEPEFTDRDYHEAICAAVELMADERQEDMGRSDFTLWALEPCAREVEYS